MTPFTESELEVDGQSYRIGRLNAKQQLHVFRRLGPILAAVGKPVAQMMHAYGSLKAAETSSGASLGDLLEPVMAVEVRTPEDYMGDVIGDINSRRGHIQAMEDAAGAKVVRALVPLSEMFGYVGDLRSKTQGRANYSMQFDSYAEVPRNVADEIVKKTRGE